MHACKCLNRALGHHEPEQLHCSLAKILQVSGTILEECDTILPQEIPAFGVLLLMVENAISGAAPESPSSVQLGCDLVIEAVSAYGLHHFHAHKTIQ